MNDYWIDKDSIIFKPKFDDKLDNFIDAMKNCKKIIFSRL